MASVTGRIKEIKQPRGGFLKPSEFDEIVFGDQMCLELKKENVHASVVGMAVDYLTRFVMNEDIKEAFNFSILGYKKRMFFLGDDIYKKDQKKKIDIVSLMEDINGLDDKSIVAACKVCTYDIWFRNPLGAISAKEAYETNANEYTIQSVRTMVKRSLLFWEKYGPIIADGFTFEKNGYTSVVDSGDGDYLTADTLWDFKVSVRKPTNKHTLQLLMYWIMGKHSEKDIFKEITKLGVYNPRLNRAYILNVNNISPEIIRIVEKDVICY